MKDLREFYDEDEIAEIKCEARRLADQLGDESEYESYIDWKYDEARRDEDVRVAALAGELRGLPGFE